MYRSILLSFFVLLTGCTSTVVDIREDGGNRTKFIQKTDDYRNGVKRQKLLSYDPPEYPKPLLDNGIEGYTIVRFSINESGIPENTEIVESDPKGIFDKSTLASVETWRYSPALKQGIPQRVESLVHTLTYCKSGQRPTHSNSHKICHDKDYEKLIKLRWRGE